MSYFCCHFYAKSFQTPTPLGLFFITPIFVQVISILLFYKKILKLDVSVIVTFHLVYGAFFTQFGVDDLWNTDAFSWCIIFGGALSLVLLRKKKYMIAHCSCYFVGAITFYFNNNKIGNDEYSNLPHLIGVFLFYPALNFYLNNLKRNLKEKKTLAEDLSQNLEKQVKNKTAELEIEKIGMENLMTAIFDQKESRDQLLNNLGQGYLIFDNEGVIQEGASKVTQELFECDFVDYELEKVKVWDVLFDEKNEKESFIKWCNIIWTEKIPFKDIKELGPKEFHGSLGKFIELDFRPIYSENHKIEKVILIASDKTKQRKLEIQLEKDKEESDFIKLCIENPVDFIDLMNDSLEFLKDYFLMDKNRSSKGHIFRIFHTYKARYGQFKQKTTVDYFNKIEDVIEREDFKAVDTYVEGLEKHLRKTFKKHKNLIAGCTKMLVAEGSAINTIELFNKLETFKSLDDLKIYIKKNYVLQDIKKQFIKYEFLITNLSKKYSKNILFQIEGDEIMVEVQKYFGLINGIIHIFRNMVEHGIEDQEQRTEKGKSKEGVIKISFEDKGESFIIMISDDGKGIDADKVKEKAIKKGFISSEDIDQLDSSKIIDLVFLPGFSTKEEVTEISGRGIGMDVVKIEVEKIKGELSVRTKVGEGTTFVMTLPKIV